MVETIGELASGPGNCEVKGIQDGGNILVVQNISSVLNPLSMCLLRPFLEFFRRYIFNVRRNRPDVTERVFKRSGSVPVELIRNSSQHLRTRSYRLPG